MAPYRHAVRPDEVADQIETRLEDLRREAELRAAHHREFIEDGIKASLPVQAALSAAVAHGIAIGVTQAWDIVESILREIEA